MNRSNAGLSALLVLASWATAAARGPDAPQRLKNLGAAGARSHLTEGWGVLGFALSNPTAEDMEARVLMFYAWVPSRQYGRDVWVPAKATLWSWSCIGPPPGPPNRNVVELKSLLYDRTGGREHLLRSPEGQPLHSDLVRFHRREPDTTLMLDVDITDGSQAPSACSWAMATAVEIVGIVGHGEVVVARRRASSRVALSQYGRRRLRQGFNDFLFCWCASSPPSGIASWANWLTPESCGYRMGSTARQSTSRSTSILRCEVSGVIARRWPDATYA
jgi:hypothetical protein